MPTTNNSNYKVYQLITSKYQSNLGRTDILCLYALKKWLRLNTRMFILLELTQLNAQSPNADIGIQGNPDKIGISLRSTCSSGIYRRPDKSGSQRPINPRLSELRNGQLQQRLHKEPVGNNSGTLRNGGSLFPTEMRKSYC